MTGSIAEEALRAKVEAMMRQRWPGGRIVHELQCGQMERRLDLACITPDRLVLAEIKSERDTLKRAVAQITKAAAVADEVWLCVAARHEAAAAELRPHWLGVRLYVDRGAAHIFAGYKLRDEPRFARHAPAPA